MAKAIAVWKPARHIPFHFDMQIWPDIAARLDSD
jgi:hypothetical protein